MTGVFEALPAKIEETTVEALEPAQRFFRMVTPLSLQQWSNQAAAISRG
jgi:hypothetical protein